MTRPESLCLALLAAVVMLAPLGLAAAQESEEEGGDAPATAPSGPFRLHIPDSMIAGLGYSGVVVMEEPASRDIVVRLASTDDSVLFPDIVVVKAGTNHGIFPITADEDAGGQVTIHAVAASHISQSFSRIYTTSETGIGLRLVAPGTGLDAGIRTHTSTLPLYVYLTNNHGTPIPAGADTQVRLAASTPSIRFSGGTGGSEEYFTTIREGEYLVRTTVVVEKTGTIYASANGVTGTYMDAVFSGDDTTVRLAFAPDTVGRNGYAYYFVWLERDGRQYVPPSLNEVTLLTSDGTIAGFGHEFNRAVGGSAYGTYIMDGMARGIIRAGDVGTAQITAIVPGIGTGTATLDVVETIEIPPEYDALVDILAEADSCGGGEFESEEATETCNFQTAVARAASGTTRATEMVIAVYPDVPARKAWGVVSGMARITETDTITTMTEAADPHPDDVFDPPSGALVPPVGVITEVTVETIVRTAVLPASFTRDALAVSGSAGISHDDVLLPYDVPEGALGANDVHAIEFEIGIINDGRHTLSVHGDELGGSTASFTSRPQYGEGYPLHIMGLLTPRNVHGEIALMFVTDEAGNIIDLTDLYGRDISAHISQSGTSILDMGQPVVITDSILSVSGTHTKKQATVFGHIVGLEADPVLIRPAGVPSGIRFWAPDRVHATEEFPVTIHAVDSNGIPTVKADRVEAATGNIDWSGRDGQRFFSVADIGETSVTIVSDDGYLDTRRIEAFHNNAADLVQISATSDNVEVGDNLILDIFTGAILDPIVEIIGGGLDFTQNEDGEYVAVPEEKGKYEVVVRVGGDGWAAHEERRTFDVSHFIDIDFDVIADDGVPIQAEMEITPAITQENVTAPRHVLIDGIRATVVPGLYSVSIQTEFIVGGDRIYTLDRLSVNGEDVPIAAAFTYTLQDDSTVEAIYNREIGVDFAGDIDSEIESVLRGTEIQGAGKYGYGDMVRLEAPILYEYGVILHLPGKWNGLPGNALVSADNTVVEFEALDSVDGYVSYERNHTLLIGIVAAAVASLPLALWRFAPDMFADIPYRLGSMAKRMRGTGGGMGKFKIKKGGKKEARGAEADGAA